jgi:predicted phage terminase large subunit-like protein
MQKTLPSKVDRKRRLAELSLYEFTVQAWPVIEPSTTFLTNWHLELICEHLEAVKAGEILRLIINQPPRTMKSISTSVMLAPWWWISDPSMRMMFASYSGDLAVDHSVARRRILESDWYKARWPQVKLTTDMNVKLSYENDKRGKMIATSVGSKATGLGGNLLVCDDLLNVRDAYSELKRKDANDFMTKTLATRLDNKFTGAIIIVMQRLHEDDPTGHLLASDADGEWTHLCIREQEKERTVIHFPRSGREVIREAHELLWPEREGEKQIASVKKLLGTRGYSAQYQQDPAPAEGTMFKDSWWRFYLPSQLPRMDEVIQSWDLNFGGGKDADYVVGLVIGRAGAEKYILDMAREQADFPATLRMFRLVSAKWPQAQAKLVESAANGAALISTLRKEIEGIIPVPPKGSKEVRAQAVTATVEAGNVLLPALSLEPLRIESWVQTFIDEHSRFPHGSNDDIVDADSQGLKRLSKPLLIATTTES